MQIVREQERRYRSHEGKTEITPCTHAAAGDINDSVHCHNADHIFFPRFYQLDTDAGAAS